MRSVHRGRSRAGISLLEVTIALGVLVLALIGLMSVFTHTTRHNATNRENRAARLAAEQKIEELMNTPFDQIFDIFKTGGSIGPEFDVTGLVSQSTGVAALTRRARLSLFTLCALRASLTGRARITSGSGRA